MLYVFLFNLSLKFPHTSSVLSPEEKAPSKCQHQQKPPELYMTNAKAQSYDIAPKVILDIEGDPHVCGLPLYVELVARLQAEWKRMLEGNYDLYYNWKKVEYFSQPKLKQDI